MRCAAIGEILFDCFPDRAVLGGAPGNVCCMLRQFGAESAMVSAVGRDPLGDRALDELARHGVDTRWIIRSDRPTGAVNVTLDGAGKASYAFAPDSAYDHLEWSGELGIFASTLDAVCWGSLARRGASAETIHRFIRAVRPGCLRVFDVNLRKPYYTAASIRESLELADVVKFNDEELPLLAEFLGVPPEQVIPRLLEGPARLIALSLGAEGAELHTRNETSRQPACPIDRRVDTVGAGDAYTATLIAGLLRNLPLDAINRHANRVAAFVCTQRGATPELPEELRKF